MIRILKGLVVCSLSYAVYTVSGYESLKVWLINSHLLAFLVFFSTCALSLHRALPVFFSACMTLLMVVLLYEQ